MLAKQGWRLFKHPESLVSRMLSAKYFPSGQIDEATLTSSPSQSWRGIYEGLKLLHKGLIWRVGQGEKIRIWEDSWIPRSSLFKPTSPANHSLQRVSDLLTASGQWDTALIQASFNEEEAGLILSIPLSARVGQDKQVWYYMPSG